MGKKVKLITERLKLLIYSHLGTQYLKYNLIGGLGVVLNLAITLALTELLFGRQNYLYAFVIGNIFNIAYNYAAFIRYIFPVQSLKDHKKAIFISYSIIIALAQVALSKVLVSFTGVDLYLPVLVLVIGVLSVISFFFFKGYIFSGNEKIFNISLSAYYEADS